MNRLCRLGAAGVLACCATAGAESDQKHEISMNRPLEVGDTMVVHAQGSFAMSVTASVEGRNESIESMQATVEFESEAEILLVDDDGRPSRVAHTIRICELTDKDGRTTVIAPKKSTITARRGTGKTIFHVEHGTLDPDHQVALELVAGLETDGPTQDVLFGSSSLHAIGDQWNIDTSAFATELTRYSPHPVSARDLEGSTTLVQIVDQRGEPCQVLHTRFTAKNALPGMGVLPSTLKIKRAKLDGQVYSLLPIDKNEPKLGEMMSMTIDLMFTDRLGPRNSYIDARITAILEGQREYRPLHDAGITMSRARNR